MTMTEIMRRVALAAADRGQPVPEGAFGQPGAFIVAPTVDGRHIIAIGTSVEVVSADAAMGIMHALCDSMRAAEARWPVRTPPGRVPE